MVTKTASKTKRVAPAKRPKAKAKKKAVARKPKAKPKAKPNPKSWHSRAVLRLVEPGSMVDCIHCGDRVKFQAKMRHQQVICNIYIKNVWERVDHFHAPCYDEADQPFGKPTERESK